MDVESRSREIKVIAEGIRLVTLQTLAQFGSGHIGGAMSVIETLAVLYGGVLRCDPENPGWPERDRLVLSKGHAGPALYAALCLRGFFSKELLVELNRGGGRLPSHCDMNKTPGVDMTTGSLGQGISTAIGLALGCRMNGSDSTTYLIIGDGECNEGQIWEGVMFASHYKLGNLITFVDWNKQQLDGFTKDVIDMGDIGSKFSAFGWHVQTVDGHNPGKIEAAVLEAKREKGKPSAIILNTVKGCGSGFAEGIAGNHHVAFTADKIDKAIDAAAQRLEDAREAARKF